MKTTDEYLLRLTIQLAKEARDAGEDPFGAVLAVSKGQPKPSAVSVINRGRKKSKSSARPHTLK